ncbi:hypothetical protein PGT21_032154 [Puccinia graminis f. sp. tritici]|uniref:Uncharacterized protein n=1 Tax=Puccinia graminis f. sp. tritici TaxID=56615 RepID=A0A5B0M8Z4_PUCGR|nr:hypothetical protein PGT21_032154 [Puccinia graminis f. sp. tritici]KAA1086335.1 hypothetical protein PGTUg99_013960 [Puccinia graminis f. sp. tritici]
MENVRPDSRQLDPVMAPCSIDSPMAVVGLPLHELNNQGETPGAMSVLEWRRAVWFEVQSIHDQSHPISQPPCRRSPSSISKHTSTISDSEDLTDKPTIGRPSRPSSRQRKRLTAMPLIDLSQPTDADGRPIQFEGGRAKLVSQPNKPKKRMMAAPDLEQRHREAMRRLQAEATEHLIYAEWEAAHQRSNPHFEPPKLNRMPSRRAPLQKLSDFARKSVSNLSVRTTMVESPSRTVASRSNTIDKSRSIAPKNPECSRKSSTRFTQMIKKFGSLKRSPSSPKMFSQNSEASMSRKSLLTSFRFSASTSAFHP